MGKITPQLAPKYFAASTGIMGPDSDPMAFTNCASERFRAYFPGSDTSRMMGLPETCRMAAPAPTSSTVRRKRAKEVIQQPDQRHHQAQHQHELLAALVLKDAHRDR